MPLAALDKFVDERFTATTVCLEKNLIVPALCLIYSGIDTMAWLSMATNKCDVTAAEFIKWTRQYMLDPKAVLRMVRIIDDTKPLAGPLITQIDCTAEDLYSARCGVLHCGTSDSRMTRNRQAVKIYYASGDKTSTDIIDILSSEDKSAYRILNIDELFEVFRNGVNIFRSSVLQNDDLLRRVEYRLPRLLVAKEYY